MESPLGFGAERIDQPTSATTAVKLGYPPSLGWLLLSTSIFMNVLFLVNALQLAMKKMSGALAIVGGLCWVAWTIVAQRYYNRAKQELRLDPSLRGRFWVEWGWT